MVFQCRVAPRAISSKGCETLPGTKGRIDRNFPTDNRDLEWLVPATLPGSGAAKHVDQTSVVIYGIMVRALDVHPRELPEMTRWDGTSGSYWR